MRHNLATTLPRRRRGAPMAAYDRLPPEVRRWLAQAALPWSPQSVARLWAKALAGAAGDRTAALARMSRAEARRIAADAALVWGSGHPAALGPADRKEGRRPASGAR